jgi:hypothetical protein
MYITAVDAESAREAALEARAECASDWAMDESGITVVGVANGDVDIVAWNDEVCVLEDDLA